MSHLGLNLLKNNDRISFLSSSNKFLYKHFFCDTASFLLFRVKFQAFSYLIHSYQFSHHWQILLRPIYSSFQPLILVQSTRHCNLGSWNMFQLTLLIVWCTHFQTNLHPSMGAYFFHCHFLQRISQAANLFVPFRAIVSTV